MLKEGVWYRVVGIRTNTVTNRWEYDLGDRQTRKFIGVAVQCPWATERPSMQDLVQIVDTRDSYREHEVCTKINMRTPEEVYLGCCNRTNVFVTVISRGGLE